MQFWLPVIFLAVLIASGLLHKPMWPAEIFLSLLPQIALISAVTSFLVIGMGRPAPGIALLVCAIFSITGAIEQFRPTDHLAKPYTLRIIWANVFGRTESLGKTIDAARQLNADIVIVAETPALKAIDTKWQNFSEYAYLRGAISGEDSAISVLSKIPLSNFEIMDVEGRKSVIIEYEKDKEIYSIAAVHPTIPLTPKKMKIRNKHIIYTAEKLSSHKSRVLIGDFNTTPWSPTMKRAEAIAKLRRLSPGWRATWISKIPFFGLPIDNVFVGNDIVGEVRIGSAIGSDHFPLIIDLAQNE